MARRFSSEQLYILRNDIKIADLMENVLKMHFIYGAGSRRFACPMCYGFNTSINPEPNLARCFTCQKNFNTIDLVMNHLKKDFVDAVKFLENYHKRSQVKKHIDNPAKEKKQPQNKLKNDTLESLGDILTKILPNRKPNNKSTSKDESFNLQKRIAELEQKVESLSSRLEKMQNLIVSKILPESFSD